MTLPETPGRLSERGSAEPQRLETVETTSVENEPSAESVVSTRPVASAGGAGCGLDGSRAMRLGRPASRSRVVDPFGVSADPAMPWLEKALDPATVLGHLVPNVDCLNTPNLVRELESIRVLRYKPSRRCLIEFELCLRLPGRPPQQISILGKARAKGVSHAGYEAYRALWSCGFDEHSADQVSVPEPLGVISELRMCLQRKVPGRRASGLLAGPEGVRQAQQIAAAALKLHRVSVRAPRRHTIGDELANLQERLAHVAQLKPESSKRLERIQGACRRLAESLPPPRPCLCHRDFYPDQVLIDGQRIWIVDLDLLSKADPCLDIGNFLGHMTELSLRQYRNASALDEQERALEECYVQQVGEAVRPSIRAYALLTLVRHIALSTQFEDRRWLTEPLMNLCEESLRKLKLI